MLGIKQQVGQGILGPTYPSPHKNWSLPPLFPWLTLAALIDWLITRTIARAAIHVPKPGLVLTIYEGISSIGIVATTFATMLVFVTLGWVIWYEWQTNRSFWLPLVLAARLILSFVFLIIVPSGWLAIVSHLLSLIAIGLIFSRIFTHNTKLVVVALFPSLAFMTSGLYQSIPAVYQTLELPGPAPFANTLFYIGELFFVVTPPALLFINRHTLSRRIWLVTGIPVLLFSGMYIANPAMTGILAIWSTGLTLYLPWLLYALSLWAACIIVVTSWQKNPAVGWVVVLLIAGGYAPQLSASLFLGLIALWLLAYDLKPELGIEPLRNARDA